MRKNIPGFLVATLFLMVFVFSSCDELFTNMEGTGDEYPDGKGEIRLMNLLEEVKVDLAIGDKDLFSEVEHLELTDYESVSVGRRLVTLLNKNASDIVKLRGDMNAWGDDEELKLEHEENDVYSTNIPVEGNEDDNLEYRYFISPFDGRDLPNDGWEDRDDRSFTLGPDNEEQVLETVLFGDEEDTNERKSLEQNEQMLETATRPVNFSVDMSEQIEKENFIKDGTDTLFSERSNFIELDRNYNIYAFQNQDDSVIVRAVENDDVTDPRGDTRIRVFNAFKYSPSLDVYFTDGDADISDPEVPPTLVEIDFNNDPQQELVRYDSISPGNVTMSMTESGSEVVIYESEIEVEGESSYTILLYTGDEESGAPTDHLKLQDK